MNILVIGGAGYIGSHVCKALAVAGWTPVTYDDLSTGHEWAVQFGPFIRAQVEDEEALDRAFSDFAPHAVVYLASLINVRDSIRDPALYYEKNLGGALKVLNAMRRAKVNRLVFSSTAAIYGSPLYTPIDEKHPKAPLNAYGKTKWAIEGLLEDFSFAYGIRYAALRFFNACGADSSGLIGEAHEPETHLIPLIFRTASEEQPFLQVYGDDYPTEDGTAIRDYIHVTDLADAHIRALSYLELENPSIQLNLGTGTGYSVKQILRAAEKICGRTIPVQISPRLAQDSPILIADPRLAHQILNWRARYSDLETILSSAWHWHQVNPKRLLSKIIYTESFKA